VKRLQTTTHELPNGLSLLHVQTGPSCLFEASAIFNVGSAAELQEKNGVSHLLEHMMYRGSGPHTTSTQFSRFLEALCGDTNAFTSAETTEYWFQSAADQAQDCLALLSEFLQTPTFSEFETEKRIIEQEIDEDYNEAGEFIDDYALALKALFGANGLGLPIGGTRETIAGLTLDDVKHHRTQWYHPKRCVLTLMSPDSPDRVLKWAEQAMKNWRNEQLMVPNPGLGQTNPLQALCQVEASEDVRIVAVNHPDNQFQLRFCFCIPRPPEPVMNAIEVLERILDDGASSRLQSVIREDRGLVYDLSCESIDFRSFFVFCVVATVSTEHLGDTFDLICSQIRSTTQTAPSVEERTRAVLRAQFDVRRLEESHHAYLEERVEAFFRGTIFDEATRISNLGSVREHDVQDAAQLLFGTKTKCVVLVGPQARNIGPRLCEKWRTHFGI
jgi:predicted Zn-dependent peptidase